jgi:malonyl-CoA/methylmalonyl-CoA synthetase
MHDPVGTDGALEAAHAAWRIHAGRHIDQLALPAELARGSLPEALHAVAAEHHERQALVVDDEQVTHGVLDDRAARAAGWLAAQGIQPGDRVIVCGPNSIAFIVGYLAVLRAGATVVPAGVGLTRPELAALVEDAEPVAALAAGPSIATLREIAGTVPNLQTVVSLDADDEAGLPVAVESGEPLPLPSISPNAVALLAYTSGTSGRPKGVPLTHGNLLASIRAAMLAWRFTEDDVLIHALPLTHQHGLGGIHATLLAGSRAVVHSRFDPARLIAAIGAERATVLFAVPAMYERLVAWEGIADADLSSLRLAISGSAPLSPRLFERVGSRLGWPPLERYGTTESGLDLSNPYDGPRKPGSVGLPLPGVEMAVVDASGAVLSAGADGEIVVRGPQVFGGYWPQSEPTEACFFPGGWFRTGDLGRVDPSDGYLSLTGRSKEVIISGGLNVYPREVELALEAHPDVRTAAVIGVPSDRWGEEVTAFVVAAGRPPNPAELLAHARSHLAAYKCPKRILVVDELPLDPMGKVSRADLRAIAELGA